MSCALPRASVNEFIHGDVAEGFEDGWLKHCKALGGSIAEELSCEPQGLLLNQSKGSNSNWVAPVKKESVASIANKRKKACCLDDARDDEVDRGGAWQPG